MVRTGTSGRCARELKMRSVESEVEGSEDTVNIRKPVFIYPSEASVSTKIWECSET